VAQELTAWLIDEQLRAAAVEVLLSRQRIAQESVGYELLSAMPLWH
jgi:hypothetical protein